MDIHGLLEARPAAWDESVSTGCLSKPTMNARDTAKRHTEIIDLSNY